MKKINSTGGVACIVATLAMSSMVMIGQNRRISKLEKENESIQNERDTLLELNSRIDTSSSMKLARDYLNKSKLLKKDIERLNKLIDVKDNEYSKSIRIIENLRNELDMKPLVEIREVVREVPVIKIKEVIKEIPTIEIKEVPDKSKVKELEEQKNVLSIKCDSQNEKIRELKGQLRDAERNLLEVNTQFSEFKSQMKIIMEAENKDSETLKQLSRTVDRVSKKANKHKGDRK